MPRVHTQFTPGGRVAGPALRGRITQLINNLAERATAVSPALAA